MICDNCSIKSICKIFDTINNPGIVLDLKACSYRKASEVMPITTESQELLKQNTQVRKSRALQDITELSNRLKAEKELEKQKAIKKNQPKVNIIETKESEEAECESCKTKTTALMNCPTCKKQICLGCAMTSIDVNGKVLNLCEECWSTDAESTTKPEKEFKTILTTDIEEL